MPESPELHARVTKMQKDIEELRDAFRDTYFRDIDQFKKRLDNVFTTCKACIFLWLEIDGFRSMKEIESDLLAREIIFAHATLWRAAERMRKGGLISKTGISDRSTVYSKKLWARELELEEYVKEKYGIQ